MSRRDAWDLYWEREEERWSSEDEDEQTEDETEDEDEQTKIQPLVRAVPNKWKFVFPPKRKITF